jgi:hypothetical protein
LKPFVEKEYIRLKDPFAGYDLGEVLMLPCVVLALEQMPRRQECGSIPLNEFGIRRGFRVEAANGPVGTVDEFVVDPADGNVTHLVLRKGHLWGQRDVFVPVSEIERAKDKVVYLRLNRPRIGTLPQVPVLRKWS